MKTGWAARRWVAAALVSVLVHGAGLAFFASRQDDVLVEGGETAGSVSIGSSFADMTAGNTADPVERPEVLEPNETREETQVVQPAEMPDQADAQPVEPEHAELAEANPSEAVEPAVDTVAAVAAEPAPASEAVLAVSPVEETVPLPDPVRRPVVEARRETPPPKAPERMQLPVPKPKPQQARRQGSGETDTMKGAADPRQARQAGSAGSRADASSSGNAAVSNYRGIVRQRLNRALRFPSGAGRARGTVTVAFVIAPNGHISTPRIVRSSGYATLDNAAVDTVRRASPFPSIPPEAGKSEWEFTVPIYFTRP
ncbi:MAG: energy transducer TonB [Flavobacteriaceae bacterium]